MSTTPDRSAPQSATSSWGAQIRSYAVLIMAILILVPSMLGFGTKFLEFIDTFRGSADGAFTISPMVNYVLASLGFFLLLLWAIGNGMFNDIERPKFTLLEREDELDRRMK